jgi:hypothetical protein
MKNKRQLVVVDWLDAWQDQDNFATAHGIASTHEPMPVQTIGWLIQDDNVGVSVANEQSTQDGHDVFRGRTFVPRAMIKSVSPFNLTRPRIRKPKNESRIDPSEPTLEQV